MSGGPTILVALDRELVERLLESGAIELAERRADGFPEPERWRWIAGHLGARIEAVLR